MSPLKLALLDLTRKRLATVIAILSIAVAVACAGLLMKLFFLSQSRFQTLASEGQAIVGAKSGQIEILLGAENLEGDTPDFIPYNLFKSIQAKRSVHFEDGANSKPTGVDAVIPLLEFAHVGSTHVIGTSEDFIKRPLMADSPVIGAGRWVKDDAAEVVLGSDVAHDLGLDIGSTLPVYARGSIPLKVDMQVVGVLKSTGKIWDHAIYSSVRAGQRLIASTPLAHQTIWGTDVLNYFIIYMQPSAFEPMKSLINERTVSQIIIVRQAREALESLTGTGQNFGVFLMALVLFLGGSSVATLMITRFDSMNVQIAVLRAIGYSRGELTAWLLWEGLILGVSACVVGGVADALVFPAVRSAARLDSTLAHGSFVLQTSLVWIAALAATVIAVALPLARIVRQDVHSALRG